MGFPTNHQPRFYATPNFLKMGINYLSLCPFWTISSIRDEKSAAKLHYIKTVSDEVVAQSIAFRLVSIYWQGSDHFPLKSWLQVTYPQPVSRTQASDAMTSRLRAMRRSVCNAGASNAGRSLCVQISRERSYPLPIYWYHLKGNWLRYNLAADSFYIMKLCSRLLVLYCRLRRYKAKCVKTRCLQEGMGQFEPRFQGEGVVLLPIYWYHLKGDWLRYNFATESFYTMKVCSRLLVLYCRNLYERRQI